MCMVTPIRVTKAMPLQAADLFAWWILYWERMGQLDWPNDVPFPWSRKKSFPGLHMRFERQDFLVEISKGLARFARTSEELDYALSLLW